MLRFLVCMSSAKTTISKKGFQFSSRSRSNETRVDVSHIRPPIDRLLNMTRHTLYYGDMENTRQFTGMYSFLSIYIYIYIYSFSSSNFRRSSSRSIVVIILAVIAVAENNLNCNSTSIAARYVDMLLSSEQSWYYGSHYDNIYSNI